MLSRPDRQTADETGCQFLRLILPDRGYRVATIKNSRTGRFENIFSSTNEELWKIIKAEDEAGHTSYHACASFKEARHDSKGTPPAKRQYGRTKRNALGANSLWCELDAGPGNPYADSRAAAAA